MKTAIIFFSGSLVIYIFWVTYMFFKRRKDNHKNGNDATNTIKQPNENSKTIKDEN